MLKLFLIDVLKQVNLHNHSDLERLIHSGAIEINGSLALNPELNLRNGTYIIRSIHNPNEEFIIKIKNGKVAYKHIISK